jgi:hypothetical protein
MVAVISDSEKFNNYLLTYYNIRMFENNSNKYGISYIGEFFSYMGRRFVISIQVKENKTVVQIFELSGICKSCIFQKSYNTSNDKSALSKSTSTFKFIDKILMM